MNVQQSKQRIHPLMAVAAISITLLSLLGIGALTGMLPNSHGLPANSSGFTSQNAVEPPPAPIPVHHNAISADTRKTALHPAQNNQPNYSQTATGQTAQGEAVQKPAPVQQQQAAAPHNSAVGIGVGAVIGGLLGNQVGSGDGKTLATIAGAVGGGYVGNEVAKRNR